MSEINPVLENADDALDVIEAFVGRIKSPFIRGNAEALLKLLRGFLDLPDNYGGDLD